MKRVLLKTVLLLVSCAAALLVLEVAVRVLFPAFDPSGHLTINPATAELPPVGPPGATQRQVKNSGDFDVTVRFNQYGLRDRRDIATCGPADWVVVGDSFSFGWGVEEQERYSDLLEAYVNARVFNLAMPCAGPAAYRRLLEYGAGLGMQTRRIILGLCMENDLATRAVGRPAGLSAVPRVAQLKKALKRSSAACFMLTCAIHRQPLLRDLFVRLGLIVPVFEGMGRNEYSPEIVAATVSALQEAVQGCDAVILVIPSRALWVGGNRETEDRLHREVVAAIGRTGMLVVDMRGPMEAGGNPLQYHFRHDGHWNPAGHRLAAHVLAGALAGSTAAQ